MPSTQSILEVVEKVNARTVFILPNNGNIIMAAQQCAHLTEKEIIVIPSKTVPQGITAMMNADFERGDPQEMAQAMTASLATVSTAQITYAARDSDFDGFAIHQGATSFGSCLVVRRASKCQQTRINTVFFIELPVTEYLRISSNVGSFCPQIEPAIRQILDRF